MTLIGIGGQFQVGKTTAAQALCRDLDFRQVAFADELKRFALEIDPLISMSSGRAHNVDAGRGRLKWAVSGLGWEGAKRTYPEVRSLLERIGMAGRSLWGEDFWINLALKDEDLDRRSVISDVRFPNEARVVKDNGGLLVRIERPGHHGNESDAERTLDGFDGWDKVFDNDGSLVELEQDVVIWARDVVW